VGIRPGLGLAFISMDPLTVRPGLVIPARHLGFVSARASGPGGQNVNKVESKVALHFDFEGCDVLSVAVKARILGRYRGRLDADGWLVVTSQKTRDRARNLEDARERLVRLLLAVLVSPKPRKPTAPSLGARRRRLDDKRRRAEKKRERRLGDVD
jgi:ribosome-associated protein